MNGRRKLSPWEAVVAFAVFCGLAFAIGDANLGKQRAAPSPDFAQFIGHVEQGRVQRTEVRQNDNTVRVALRDGTEYRVGYVDGYAEKLTDRLLAGQVPVLCRPL
jgi:hypothetical protein